MNTSALNYELGRAAVFLAPLGIAVKAAPQDGDWVTINGARIKIGSPQHRAITGEVSEYGEGFKPNPMSADEQRKVQAQGEKSLAKAMKEEADIPAAMTRSDIGSIDFVWGDVGGGPPKNKGAHGLAGIKKKHGEKSLRAMPEVIAKGDLGPLYEKGTKRNLRFGDYTAIIKLNDKGKDRVWLLNGFGPYEDDPPEQQAARAKREKKGLMDIEGGLDPCEPTHQTPTHGILSFSGSNPIEDIDADQTEKFQGKSEQIMTDTLIHYGSSIKTSEETETGWKFGGYLVVFDSPDISRHRDMFTKSTDYDVQNGDRRSIYYNHGLDGTIKRAKLGDCRIQIKDAGVWIEGEIRKRSDYLKEHAERIASNIERFGLSSGAPAHLVERKSVGDGHEVLLWPIAEASITPTPAEPLTSCVSLKSLIETEPVNEETPEEAKAEAVESDSDPILELRSGLRDGLGFVEYSAKVRDAVAEVVAHIDEFADVRCVKSERRWSEGNYAALVETAQALEEAAGSLKATAQAHAPRSARDEAAIRDAMVQYQLTLARLNGVMA